MAKLMSILVVFSMAFFLSTNSVKATDCVSVLANIFPCMNYLGNVIPITPGNKCCDAASNIVKTRDSINNLCQCFKQNPLASGFLPSKAQQLPNLCNLTSSFLPLVNCLVPSGQIGVPLPPLTPLPPLIPVPPLPLIPIPPLTPLPPFIPIPPLTPLPPFIPFPPLFPAPPPAA
ncbi:hypothetical protein DH2020_041747 [Rehmannia glutinosa]|uniref:Bifunctional inhibitor/plant lipid transfer protein/seed storage helical domain-containing protein n=1 Tax=Rehmannia glutinosa TaxID=99300 RepID=A0ABR0UQE4_REHGL